MTKAGRTSKQATPRASKWVRTCAECLRRSIVLADSLDNSRWGVTPYEAGLNLNVGMVQTLTVCDSGVFFNLRGSKVPRALPKSASVVTEVAERRYRSLLNTGFDYLIVKVGPKEAQELFDRLWDRHADYIRAAASTSRNPMMKKAHDQVTLAKLGEAIGHTFPTPAYAAQHGMQPTAPRAIVKRCG